jgi:exonuclease SbcC
LKSGDPCPVCERPLEHLPKTDRKALDRAAKALERAEGAKEAAVTGVANAERGKALADQALKTAGGSLERYEKELAHKRGRAQEVREQLRTVLGPKTEDATAEITQRIAEIDELVAAEAAARDKLSRANEEAGRRKIALERKERQISEIGIELRNLPLTGLVERVRDVDAGVESPPNLPDELPDDPAALAPIAAGLAKDLEKLAEDLEAAGNALRKEMKKLLDSARSLLPDGSDRGVEDLQTMIAAAKAGARQLANEAAAAESRVKTLKDRLATRSRLEDEIARDRAEFDLYAALGKELKSDRIVSFLQAEALRVLATAAGVHLRELSRTRYDLEYEDDRFYVIDAWNGNERRNVKTLSGGETFLASLALALALSEQVQYLAVTERERLESLFLDEGFGTLDPETLEAVVEGIEQLGRDGRLVGVITHVPELAERLPVRLKVTKSPRGSTIKRDPETPVL